MSLRRETCLFGLLLACLVSLFLGESLFKGKILSPADTLLVGESFRDVRPQGFEPANRLLIDAALQFQPWLEFNRKMIRQGRLPLWNDNVGCGAPHLANGQSAVFDPFHLIAYLGPLPQGFAWIAAARLWIAGLGSFFLARRWGLRGWGRWFAGLCYPFSGFLVLWLLFPVTSVAIWLPWLILASENAVTHPDRKTIAKLALITGFVLLGGHIQTSAHVLMAALVYVGWKLWSRAGSDSRRTLIGKFPAVWGWSAGIGLGIGLAAVAVVPLGFYLKKSDVWAERASNRASFWKITEPKLLDMACTAVPYLYGSQRRGDANLARPLKIRNLNEAAGGFAGLACLIVLAPCAFTLRSQLPIVGFLLAFSLLGLLASFDIPPVPNLIRLIPVVNVMDQRRWALWVSFGLVMLGGVGLDRIAYESRPGLGLAFAVIAVAFGIGGLATSRFVSRFEPQIRARASAYSEINASNYSGARKSAHAGLNSVAVREQRVNRTVSFLRRSCRTQGIDWLAIGSLGLVGLRLRSRHGSRVVAAGFLALNLIELFGFGFGMNPAIEPRFYQPKSGLIRNLEQTVGNRGRVVGLGSELPPNTLMRFGLADLRNYDSIEMRTSLAWFDRLYEPDRDRSSRRVIDWSGVLRSIDVLRTSGVKAIVADTPVPDSKVFSSVDHTDGLWIGRLDADRLVQAPFGATNVGFLIDHGRVRASWELGRGGHLVVLQTYDPGWRAWVDGVAAEVRPHCGAFLKVAVKEGSHRVELRYNPVETRIASGCSLVSLLLIVSLWMGGLASDCSQKNLMGSWNSRNSRIRMDSSTSSRNLLPANH